MEFERTWFSSSGNERRPRCHNSLLSATCHLPSSYAYPEKGCDSIDLLGWGLVSGARFVTNVILLKCVQLLCRSYRPTYPYQPVCQTSHQIRICNL